jgi:hypothetical protein
VNFYKIFTLRSLFVRFELTTHLQNIIYLQIDIKQLQIVTVSITFFSNREDLSRFHQRFNYCWLQTKTTSSKKFLYSNSKLKYQIILSKKELPQETHGSNARK